MFRKITLHKDLMELKQLNDACELCNGYLEKPTNCSNCGVEICIFCTVNIKGVKYCEECGEIKE